MATVAGAWHVEDLADYIESVRDTLNSRRFKPALQALVPKFEEGFTDNFARSAEASGVAWQPRKSQKAANPLLILTAALVRSVGTNAPGHFEEIGDEEGELGTNIKYARFHQYGTKAMPARPYLDVADHIIDEGAEIVADEMLKLIL